MRKIKIFKDEWYTDLKPNSEGFVHYLEKDVNGWISRNPNCKINSIQVIPYGQTNADFIAVIDYEETL